MVEITKKPKLEKPTWLKQSIDGLNWDILTYKVYVGDAIEKAIDWVIDTMGYIAESAGNGLNELDSRITYLQQAFGEILHTHTTAIYNLTNRLDTLEQGAGTWLEAGRDTIEGWISSRLDPIKRLALALNDRVQVMSQDILDLRDEARAPWWSPTRVLGAIAEALSPFKKLEEDRKNLFEWLWLFFLDPPLFLYEMTTEIIVRFF